MWDCNIMVLMEIPFYTIQQERTHIEVIKIC